MPLSHENREFIEYISDKYFKAQGAWGGKPTKIIGEGLLNPVDKKDLEKLLNLSKNLTPQDFEDLYVRSDLQDIEFFLKENKLVNSQPSRELKIFSVRPFLIL